MFGIKHETPSKAKEHPDAGARSTGAAEKMSDKSEKSNYRLHPISVGEHKKKRKIIHAKFTIQTVDGKINAKKTAKFTIQTGDGRIHGIEDGKIRHTARRRQN